MSSVPPVQSASRSGQAQPGAIACPSALPEPTAQVSVAQLTSILMMLEARNAEGSKNASQSRIETDSNLQKWAQEKMRQAQIEAREAESNGSSWDKLTSTLSTVAEVAAAAAAVATVATGGAGLPAFLALAGATMSLSATVGRQAGWDPKLCNGLALGGCLLSLGSGVSAASSGTKAAEASGQASGGASKSSALSMRDVAKGCRALAGSATAASGGTSMAAGHYHQQGALHAADAMQARQDASRYDTAQKDHIDRLDEIAQSASDAVAQLIQMQTEAQASAMQIIHSIGRRA
ncbi:MAG: hypothetical protein HY898_22335 [Deltaproteobacteria bacterium]|nr:hypothetical protein [Deltaproteobacteria bacterium]